MEYHFFYGGPFSQWNQDYFTGAAQFVIDDIGYNCTEQFMMVEKARLFGDMDALKKIMALRHPRDQKAVGRKVNNFDKEMWEGVARDLVYKGNWAKFSQNNGLEYELQDTGDKMLVEASPTDRIWGIGVSVLDAQDQNIQPEDWHGTNWLGQVITLVREDMRAGKQSDKIDWEKIPWK